MSDQTKTAPTEVRSTIPVIRFEDEEDGTVFTFEITATVTGPASLVSKLSERVSRLRSVVPAIQEQITKAFSDS